MDLVSLLYGRQERSWQAQANCMGVDPDLFFPERGASTREAKEVCRGCVVREDCLEYALANGEKFGIWGGMSERERRRLRRARAMQRRAAMVSASADRPGPPTGPRSSSRAEVQFGPAGIGALEASTAAGNSPTSSAPFDRAPPSLQEPGRPGRRARPGRWSRGSTRLHDTWTWSRSSSPSARTAGPRMAWATERARAMSPPATHRL